MRQLAFILCKKVIILLNGFLWKEKSTEAKHFFQLMPVRATA